MAIYGINMMMTFSPESFENYILSLLKNPVGIDLSLFKDHLLNKYIVEDNFGISHADEEILYYINILKKYGIIPSINDIELLRLVRDKNFITQERTTPWIFEDANIIDSNNGNTVYSFAKAKFHLINKWEITGDELWYKIVIDKNKLNILWADLGNRRDDNELKNNEYLFIEVDKNVYQVHYVQPDLYFFINPCKKNKIVDLKDSTLDKFINNECDESINSGYGFILDLDFSLVCDLENCIEKHFFKNGPKWKHGKNTIMSGGETATAINKIYSMENKIFIEIKNNTFKNPRGKLISVDLKNKIIRNENDNKEAIIEEWESPFY